MPPAGEGGGRLTRAAPCLVAAAIPLLVFLISPWRIALDPTRIGWLVRGDAAQHQLGWEYFAREPAGLSPRISAWPHPFGTTIGLTDSIPLVALPLRGLLSLAGARDVTFQYFGLWLAICLGALGGAGAWTLRELGAGRLLAALGGGLVALNPVVWERMARGHFSLCALALLVAALALWVRAARTGSRADLLRFGALPALAAAIHPYLSLMAGALWVVALAFETRRAGRETLRWGVPAMLGAAVAALAVAGTCGFYDPAAKLDVGGFGGYSADLAALLLPAGRSRWLSFTAPGERLTEGFAYLGAGVLSLALVGGCAALAGRLPARRPLDGVPAPSSRAGLGPLLIGSGVLAIVAVLPTVRLFGRELADLRGLLAPLESAFAAFRANGRLVWPFQIVVLLVVVRSLRRFESRPILLAALVGGAIVLQATELPHDPPRIEAEPAAPSEVFNAAAFGKGARHLSFVPPLLADGGEIVCGTRNRLYAWERAAYLAVRAGWSFDSGVFARLDRAAARAECERLDVELRRGHLRPDTVYLVRRGLARRLERRRGVTCAPSPLDGWFCRLAP